MKRLFSTFLFFVILLWSALIFGQSNSRTTLKDITYRIVNQKDSIKLDVFLPKVKKFTKTPVVFNIHGGAWIKGSKEIEKYYYMKSLRDSLQQMGYAFISINYRLLNNKTHLNEQLNDVYTAFNWVKENADLYYFDLNNVGVIGESAGAHLALLLTYSIIEKPAIQPKYIIDLFGPTDLNDILKTNAGWGLKTAFKLFKPNLYKLRNQLLYQMTAHDIVKDKAKVIEQTNYYSPINYINESTSKTPILILHGTADPIVSYQQSLVLIEKLKQNKIENSLLTVEEGNHGFTTSTNEDLNVLINNTLDFIKLHYTNSVN